MSYDLSIEIRSPQDQADFERLRAVLTDTLGLDWRSTAGSPDGAEVADDCAEDLWAAGFRHAARAVDPTGDVGPMRVFLSPLTGRAYVLTRYTEDAGSGRIVADEKHDVTADVVHDLMAAAWARGWNECNAATEGDAPPNPCRPHAAHLAAQRPTPAPTEES